MTIERENFWDTIEELAKFIKEVDPNHPSMTVIAGLDPSKAYLIKERCPSIDILGLNAYGSIENASTYIMRLVLSMILRGLALLISWRV